MPFGIMFGALTFAVLGLGFGGQLVANSGVPDLVHRILWGAFGATLSLGLLMRHAWARWTGVAASALLAVLGIRQVATRGSVLDHVILLAAFVTLVLLLVPATGDLRRGGSVTSRDGRVARSLGWAGVASLVGATILIASGAGSAPPLPKESAPTEGARLPLGVSPRSREARTDPATPSPVSPRGSSRVASGQAADLQWQSFGAGMERARAESKPAFVMFHATWCGACRALERGTLRDPAVVQRLRDVVPVRVDGEEEVPRDGHRGAQLAARFGVRGYPTLVMLDSDGREISRQVGVLPPRAFLDWLDQTLDSPRRASSSRREPVPRSPQL